MRQSIPGTASAPASASVQTSASTSTYTSASASVCASMSAYSPDIGSSTSLTADATIDRVAHRSANLIFIFFLIFLN